VNRESSNISNHRFILCAALWVWLLFVASFFMPVTTGIDMVGWQAFGHYMSLMWDLPEYWQNITREPLVIFISTFPSTNGAVFLAPIILFRWPRWSGVLGFALVIGGLVPIVGFYQMVAENQLRVGYYCWVTSICLMAILSFLCAKRVKVIPFRRRAVE
jgi:hypothetical protein